MLSRLQKTIQRQQEQSSVSSTKSTKGWPRWWPEQKPLDRVPWPLLSGFPTLSAPVPDQHHQQARFCGFDLSEQVCSTVFAKTGNKLSLSKSDHKVFGWNDPQLEQRAVFSTLLRCRKCRSYFISHFQWISMKVRKTTSWSTKHSCE